MRFATWNVNSLKARVDKVWWWLERAAPDVLLLQETKLADGDAPVEGFRDRGYELAHHGSGRWNGVAIASRVGIDAVVTNFGEPLREIADPESLEAPLSETRMIAARCAGIDVVSVYVPNGRSVGSPFFLSKLAWLQRLQQWIEAHAPEPRSLILGGDINIAPADADVWDPARCHGGTHVSPEERQAFARLLDWGLVDAYRSTCTDAERYTWWDYRAGMFHKNYGMRIDHLLLTPDLAARVQWAEIDREARKGKPTPSDHAPLVVDIDERGKPFEAKWKSAEARIAARRKR